MRHRGGFTLAEIILALGILATVSLVIIGLFTRLLASSTKNTDLTAANLLARGVLDKAIRSGKPNWGTSKKLADAGGSVTDMIKLDGNDSTTEFEYQLEVTRETSNPAAIGQLYRLDVTVSWWSEKGSSKTGRHGYGKLSTQLSRTVYVRGEIP